MEVAAVRVGVHREEQSAFEISKSVGASGKQLECGPTKTPPQ